VSAVHSIGQAGGIAPEADLTRTLYERHAAQIYRFCFHELGTREEAEDAVQSTFLNAFRGIKGGVVPASESAWLFKIAHNVCLTRRRSSWRRGRVESPTDFEVVEELAPAPPRRADELIGLQDVLERLPEQQRRAILLREWQGLSYREIGRELALSQAAVETLIFRARRSLAEGLEAPVESRSRRRLASGALGGLLTLVQSFLAGGGAVKVVAVVAAAGAGGVVASAPLHHRLTPPRPSPPAAKHLLVQRRPPVVSAPPAHRSPTPHIRHAVRQVAPPAVHVPPRRAKKATHVPPGQAKKAAAAPAPAPAPKAHGHGHGRSTAPGQLKHHATHGRGLGKGHSQK
jgi:RNA polymerase sigma factor (sigma-70 family)